MLSFEVVDNWLYIIVLLTIDQHWLCSEDFEVRVECDGVAVVLAVVSLHGAAVVEDHLCSLS